MSQTDARAYARLKYRLLLVDMAVGFAFLGFFQWSGASMAIARWWEQVTPSPAPQLLGYLASFGTAYYVVNLPLHVYSSFFMEHRFGLSSLSSRGWLVRELKRVTLSAVLATLCLEGLYFMLRELPSSWPFWATVAWVGLNVVMARVFPTVLLPIFYKTRPLQQQTWYPGFLSLCERAGLPALGVFRFDLGAETRKANAALAGLGRTRRVLLADTLLDSFPPEEIEGVLAHELAHHRYRHITLFLIMSAVGSWIAFQLTQRAAVWWIGPLGLTGIDDLAGLPVLMLWFSLLGCLVLPLQNGVSRFFERQADQYAVQMTGAQPFAAALRRLATLNLADPSPPRWIAWLFYDHPPIMDRIAAAESSAP